MAVPPGTEERTALVEIEARLHKLQTRFNLYTAQHQLYRVGAVLALGVAVSTVLAFSVSSFWFSAAAWPLFGVAGVICFRLLRQAVSDWTDLNSAARRVDVQVGLKQRLATLAAQTAAGVPYTRPATRLWAHLVHDNLRRLSQWEVKRVAPSRIPLSLLPFLAAILLACAVASIPLLSPASEPVPFSLTNIGRVTSELPERAGQLVDERLFPDPPNERGRSDQPVALTDTPPLSQHPLRHVDDHNAPDQSEASKSLGRELRELASLPADIQQALREALQGLPESQDAQAEENMVPDEQADEANLASSDDLGLENRLVSQELAGEAGRARQAGENGAEGDGDASLQGNAGRFQKSAQALRGSGLHRLRQARLAPRDAARALRSGNPQRASRAGSAGTGGMGAGTGTDPQLYGNPAKFGGNDQTFSLSLDASFEKSRTGNEVVKDEGGGVISKSTSQLNETQAFDDAIRNAQIPPEYEDIIKHLFSRGETP